MVELIDLLKGGEEEGALLDGARELRGLNLRSLKELRVASSGVDSPLFSPPATAITEALPLLLLFGLERVAAGVVEPFESAPKFDFDLRLFSSSSNVKFVSLAEVGGPVDSASFHSDSPFSNPDLDSSSFLGFLNLGSHSPELLERPESED